MGKTAHKKGAVGGWAEMGGTRKRSVRAGLRVLPLGGDMGGTGGNEISY